MFRHVVLLQLTEGRPAGSDDAIVAALEALPGQVPSLRGYEIVRDAGVDAGNADLAVVATFDDAAGYAAYRDHPAHRAVITELIAPVLAARSALQHHVGGTATGVGGAS